MLTVNPLLTFSYITTKLFWKISHVYLYFLEASDLDLLLVENDYNKNLLFFKEYVIILDIYLAVLYNLFLLLVQYTSSNKPDFIRKSHY